MTFLFYSLFKVYWKKWTDSKTMKICNSYAPDSRLHHTPCADGEFEPRLAGAGVAN